MRIITWNINSVRLRINLIEKLIATEKPDILCLQETKCPNDQFPYKAFYTLGYEYIVINGIKGYNGVATISKMPLINTHRIDFCDQQDGRHIEVVFNYDGFPCRLHNLYVPAGGDEADRDINIKFAHKLDFLEEMYGYFHGSHKDRKEQSVLVGDFNVAPFENDVWSHKQLLKVVSHTPIEVNLLNKLKDDGHWDDVSRRFIPSSQKLYSWWSYRSRDWQKSDRGRRLDHIWVTPILSPRIIDYRVLRDVRGWERPSDHVPVLIELKSNF